MRHFLLGLLLVGSLETTVRAEDRYYVILFASQREGNVPRTSHTWATFVKVNNVTHVSQDETLPAGIEAHTISWLPATMSVVPRVRAEPGRNFGLKETLQGVYDLGARVTAWGPLEISRELYDLSRRRKEQLDSGVLGYKMVDVGVRPAVATNCIHAISDIVPGALIKTGTARGEAATLMVAQHLRPYMIQPEVNHAELVRRLGLDAYTIVWRGLR